MKRNGINRPVIVTTVGLAMFATVAGMYDYVARELLVALLFFFILFSVIGVAVAVFLVIDEIASKAFLWLQAHAAVAHLHFRHATAARGVVSAIHKG
jgi:hypothetical protein